MANDDENKDDEVYDDEDPYSERGRKEMRDDDEISSEEEGFLEGYDEAEEEGYKEKDAGEEETEE